MRRIRKSFGYSWEGLAHGMKTEKNLQLFVPVFVIILITGAFLQLLSWEWLALLMSGTIFMAVELLNTAVERLTDVLDDQKKVVGRNHYHAMLKAAKDTGAAASLVCLFGVVAVIVIVFWPYVRLYV